VYDAAGNKGIQSINVTVKDMGSYGQLNVLVLDDDTGLPVENATVVLCTEADGEQRAYTDKNGTFKFICSEGTAKAYAYKQDYAPVERDAAVTKFTINSTVLRINESKIVTGSMSTRRMSPMEIEAEGINVDDPANQYVYEFKINIKVGVEQKILTFYGNGSGQILSYGHGYNDYHIIDQDRVIKPVVIPSTWPGVKPTFGWMSMPFSARCLKEFFEVDLTLSNNADPQFVFDKASAELLLPGGLSLANTSEAQSMSVDLGKFEGGSSRDIRWIVRGDSPGNYCIAAAFTGILQPFNAGVQAVFEPMQPMTVYGGTACP
jgi:hypothetical protein